MLPCRAETLWKSAGAVERARAKSLEWAREEQRRRKVAASALVFHEMHDGQAHLDFFNEQFPQVIKDLPQPFTAVEIGAGMGWHAALLAARGGQASTVLATEFQWAHGKGPRDLPNLHALHRLAKRDGKLETFLDFSREEGGHLRGVTFLGALEFARAAGEALPVRDGGADLVYTINCIEHIPKLAEMFAEAERVLCVGGVFFGTTEPLYFSPFGHHLSDVFPLPWGHLLWSEEEFADIVMREAGPRMWAPGIPASAKVFREEVLGSLNGASPAAIRAAIQRGAWQVAAWSDLAFPGTATMAAEVGLGDALNVAAESFLLTGLRFRLVRRAKASGLRLPLRLPWTLRRKLGRG